MIPDCFANLRLPAQVTQKMRAGEVISFEYGSYLKVGAGLSVGCEQTGSLSFDIGQLQLSEHYDLSVIGLGVNAQVAGNCQVEVRSPGETHATGTKLGPRHCAQESFECFSDCSQRQAVSVG